MKLSVESIESMGLVDGPGIRTVIFLNGCMLRCKYCHNPEMWNIKDKNMTEEEIIKKILRNKPYFKNNGGVTFSGGEPLLQLHELTHLCKKLKELGIHICLDTSGVGMGNYEELLSYIDIVLLDIKHTESSQYKSITGIEKKEVENFIDACNKCNKSIWIRQVIIPNVNDNYEYMDSLYDYLKHIKNSEKIEFLPFHRLGREKYIKLGITYPYEDKNDMDKEKCNQLLKYLKELRKDNEYN
jgi:pyruvate formate lyase activating enzyme